MDYARNYYAVLSSVSGIMLGIIGIILGYFYFDNRIQMDEFIQKRDRRGKRLETFISKLDQCDENVHRILAHAVSNDSELTLVRTYIQIIFENITSMLDNSEELLGITKDDVRIILKVNSFVDNNDIITRYSFSDLSITDISTVREDYIEQMRAARNVCFQSIK
jgi:hypothetical protein